MSKRENALHFYGSAKRPHLQAHCQLLSAPAAAFASGRTSDVAWPKGRRAVARPASKCNQPLEQQLSKKAVFSDSKQSPKSSDVCTKRTTTSTMHHVPLWVSVQLLQLCRVYRGYRRMLYISIYHTYLAYIKCIFSLKCYRGIEGSNCRKRDYWICF